MENKTDSIESAAMKHQIKYHPNASCISIHIDKKLTDDNCWFESGKDVFDKPYDIDENVRYLAGALFQINGITDVFLDQYEITLTNGTLFEWEVMIPEIIKTIDVMINADN